MNAVFSKSNSAAEWARKKILPRESYTTLQASGFASRHTTALNKPSNHSAAWRYRIVLFNDPKIDGDVQSCACGTVYMLLICCH